jgi:hypothetical protein
MLVLSPATTGILGLPYAFRKGGIAGGCVTMLISAVTINYCIKKLIKVRPPHLPLPLAATARSASLGRASRLQNCTQVKEKLEESRVCEAEDGVRQLPVRPAHFCAGTGLTPPHLL